MKSSSSGAATFSPVKTPQTSKLGCKILLADTKGGMLGMGGHMKC